MQNATTTLEDSSAISYTSKHTLILQSRNYASWYSTETVKNLYPKKKKKKLISTQKPEHNV